MKHLVDLPTVALSDDDLARILGVVGLPHKAFITFHDLQAAGLVKSYDALTRLQAVGFPQGKWLSPNRRVWHPQDVAAYLAALPTERPKLPEEMKRRRPPNAERVKPAKRRGRR
jgi:hypothetical protein